MPPLSQHQSNKITKLLLIGDSGTGKTGALASLVAEGYKLRILDMDNGLDSLTQQCKKRNLDMSKIDFRTLRDKLRSTPAGPVIDGQPKAFVEAVTMLDNWKYQHEGQTIDLGKPESWGDDTVLVIDSLTFLSNAAMAWASVVKVPHGARGQDGRAVYGEAQKALEHVLSLLTSEHFRANVVVISHIAYIDRDDGTRKGYPMATGQSLSPKIPAYFNSVALCESQGTGANVRRTIRTAPTSMIDLKNPASFRMAEQLPIESALADFFKTVKG
jgi:hypothetical protein